MFNDDDKNQNLRFQKKLLAFFWNLKFWFLYFLTFVILVTIEVMLPIYSKVLRLCKLLPIFHICEICSDIKLLKFKYKMQVIYDFFILFYLFIYLFIFFLIFICIILKIIYLFILYIILIILFWILISFICSFLHCKAQF